MLGFLWRNTVCRVGEDWVFLTILAIVMGITGFAIDTGINLANQGNQRLSLFKHTIQTIIFSFINQRETGFTRTLVLITMLPDISHGFPFQLSSYFSQQRFPVYYPHNQLVSSKPHKPTKPKIST